MLRIHRPDVLADAGHQGVDKRNPGELTRGMRPRQVHGAGPEQRTGTRHRPGRADQGEHPAKVEHPFRAIKQQFGHAKARFRGLTKNTARLTRLCAPSSLWMARRQPSGLQALPYRADQRCGPDCRPSLGEST
jgi:transposase, IS5 family